MLQNGDTAKLQWQESLKLFFVLGITWNEANRQLSRVCFAFFVFCSCKRSRNVTFRKNIYVSCQPPLWMRSFMLRSLWYHSMKQLRSCENQRNYWKKNVKCLKDEVCGSKRITSTRIPSGETHKHWGAETAQYGVEIIFKRINFKIIVNQLKWKKHQRNNS